MAPSSTFDPARATREQIWSELRQVARSDSRFHWGFSSFIPDFEGGEICTEKVLALDAYQRLGDRRLFVTPDNSTEDFRRRLLLEGWPFVITT